MYLSLFRKGSTLVMAALMAGFSAGAQSIPNPGFETSASCPTGNSQFRNNVASWSVSLGALAGSTDYFKSCGYSITGADYGGIAAQSGDGFAGAYVEYNNPGTYTDYKEYFTAPLSAPLVAGVTYTFSFYTAHLYGTSVPASGHIAGTTYTDLLPGEQGYLGAVFSTAAPVATNTGNGLGGAPRYNSIRNDFGSGRALIPASNTTVYGAASRNTWVPVTLRYTAVGGETYMTVGQFRPGGTSFAGNNATYYLFDEFSTALTVLPVNFGNIQAVLTNNQLSVNWQTLTETNNDHFIIEVSTDGASFTSIGKVGTLAANGNSDASHNYTFSRSINGAALGAGLFAVLVSSALGRKRRMMAALLMGLGCTAALYSCSKNNGNNLADSESKYFVRIAQVDIDGTKSYSKTVTVVKR